MNKKPPASVEFLMTYGWAILVVLVAICPKCKSAKWNERMNKRRFEKANRMMLYLFFPCLIFALVMCIIIYLTAIYSFWFGLLFLPLFYCIALWEYEDRVCRVCKDE